MFTAVAHKNLADAESYFDEHLAQNDYYAAGEIRPGQSIGVGAERLGLKAEVTREQFHSLCENHHPETGERLTQRQLKLNKRRVLYDFTCSAPKSVSVLAVIPPLSQAGLIKPLGRPQRYCVKHYSRDVLAQQLADVNWLDKVVA